MFRKSDSSDEIKALEQAIVETAFKVKPSPADLNQQKTHSERLRVLRESLSSPDPVPKTRNDVEAAIEYDSPPERDGPLQGPNWGYMKEYKEGKRRSS